MPPALPPDAPQSQAAADVNAVGQGLVSGTGAVIAGAGRQATAAGERMTQQQLAAMDAIDQCQDVPADQDILGYGQMSPAQRLSARADIKAADARAERADPGWHRHRGRGADDVPSRAGRGHPDRHRSRDRRHGSAVAASTLGSAAGGPVGRVLAGAVVIGSQAYDGTYQGAVARGASPKQAEDAAGKAAMGQIAALSLPIGKVST